MKTEWMSRGFLVLALMASQPVFANVNNGVDPGYVKIKVYEMRVSPNADCSNPITVFQNAAPAYQDFAHNPTLGAGAIPNGTYKCVLMKMSDFIHYTPATTNPGWAHSPPACVVGTDKVSDVGHDEDAVDPDGTSHAMGAAGTENIVWLYVRQGASSNSGNSFAPTGGIPLTSPLVVNGDGAHTMVFDFSGRIGEELNNSTWDCGCDAPTLGFR
jgi:hypothetical protein